MECEYDAIAARERAHRALTTHTGQSRSVRCDRRDADRRFTRWRIALHLALTTLNLTRKLPTLRRPIERIDSCATDDEAGREPLLPNVRGEHGMSRGASPRKAHRGYVD